MLSIPALLLAGLSLIVGPARAEGFALRDLTELDQAARSALGADYVSRAAPARLTVACLACPGTPRVDILLSHQEDRSGEESVRSGETSIAMLQATCQARDPSCSLEGLRVSPAVGWRSSWSFGGTAAQTIVVLRDGDVLTIRSHASDPALARRNADRMITDIVPRVVGR